MTINRDKPLKVMLVAAEASGDALGAGLAKALRARLGQGVTFVGIGGAKMAEQGVQSPFDIAQLSILGILESLKAYPRAMARLKDTVALAAREKPDVAVLIDSWGFNIRLAHALRRLDPTLPLVKYVAPQVWAYREGRAQALAKAVDLLLSIQPMDKAYFDAAGLQNVFVGNSALAKRFDHADPGRLRAAIGAAASQQILLVLPGSRPSEIERVMPAVRGRRSAAQGRATGSPHCCSRRLHRRGGGKGSGCRLAVPRPCHRGRGPEGRRVPGG